MVSMPLEIGHHSIRLDGKECAEAIQGYTLRHYAGQRPVIELDVVVLDPVVSHELADVVIPEKTVNLLKWLGWKEPDNG